MLACNAWWRYIFFGCRLAAGWVRSMVQADDTVYPRFCSHRGNTVDICFAGVQTVDHPPQGAWGWVSFFNTKESWNDWKLDKA